jgi:coenzyme F420-dependent glucose-6-phosphate dehydrogenase
LKGPLNQELALPEHFAAAAEGVTEEDVAEVVPHGPDPGPMLEQIQEFAEAGFTHVYVHQIGHDQQGFLDFAKRELLPQFS